MREIKTKEEFYKAYEKGLFGNKVRTWGSYEELKNSGWKGGVCIRGQGIPRHLARYNIPINKVQKAIKEIDNHYKKRGTKRPKIKFNQAMPDEKLLIQGEVMRGTQGLYLLYTTIKKPTNLAFAEEEIIEERIKAKMTLQRNLCPSSFSDLETLLDIYSESVIEFSTYSVNVGNIPNRNTVFWEVRNY